MANVNQFKAEDSVTCPCCKAELFVCACCGEMFSVDDAARDTGMMWFCSECWEAED